MSEIRIMPGGSGLYFFNSGGDCIPEISARHGFSVKCSDILHGSITYYNLRF